jgi:predicted DNA-binding protein
MEKNDERMHINLSTSLRDELKTFSDKWGLTSSMVVRLAIAHYISLGNPMAVINGEKR